MTNFRRPFRILLLLHLLLLLLLLSLRLVAILWVGEWLKTNIFSPCGEEVLEDEVEEEEEAEEKEENWRKDR